jgi:hypothetical protein
MKTQDLADLVVGIGGPAIARQLIAKMEATIPTCIGGDVGENGTLAECIEHLKQGHRNWHGEELTLTPQ